MNPVLRALIPRVASVLPWMRGDAVPVKTIPSIAAPSRVRYRWSELPYGLWTCANGREVVFNRHYQAIYERHDGITAPALRDEWVRFAFQSYFYDDARIPTTRRLKVILAAFEAGVDMRRWLLA